MYMLLQPEAPASMADLISSRVTKSITLKKQASASLAATTETQCLAATTEALLNNRLEKNSTILTQTQINI
jgi:hypothetical protein